MLNNSTIENIVDKVGGDYDEGETFPDDLKCSVCQDMLFMPMTLACQHNFCRDCIDGLRDARHMCPMCKDKSLFPGEYNRAFDAVISATCPERHKRRADRMSNMETAKSAAQRIEREIYENIRRRTAANEARRGLGAVSSQQAAVEQRATLVASDLPTAATVAPSHLAAVDRSSLPNVSFNPSNNAIANMRPFGDRTMYELLLTTAFGTAEHFKDLLNGYTGYLFASRWAWWTGILAFPIAALHVYRYREFSQALDLSLSVAFATIGASCTSYSATVYNKYTTINTTATTLIYRGPLPPPQQQAEQQSNGVIPINSPFGAALLAHFLASHNHSTNDSDEEEE